MALKLATEADKTMPKVVEASLTHRLASLQHQAAAKLTNAKKVKQAGALLHRMHDDV